MPTALIIPYCAALLAGLIVGSLITQLAWRLPRMMEAEFARAEAVESGASAPEWASSRYGLFTPAPACTTCGHAIDLRDRVPVLSYLLLSGRCRACSTGIGMWYLSVEAATALVALLCAYRFGFTLAGLAVFLCCALLLVIALVDLTAMLIPDSLTACVAALGVVSNFLWLPLGWEGSLVGAACGLAVFWVASTSYRLITAREGVGFGDVKLVGALGAWIGVGALPFLALLGSATFLGYVALRRTLGAEHQDDETALPFGPALAFAGAILILAPGLSERFFHLFHAL
jgi:leader peptidase (prepilin peptidase)/N-methyltransferase